MTPVLKLADRDDAYKAEVVAKLRELLAAAERGEILSVVYACERPGGSMTIGTTHMRDRYVVAGYLNFMLFKTMQSIDDDSTPSDLEDGA